MPLYTYDVLENNRSVFAYENGLHVFFFITLLAPILLVWGIIIALFIMQVEAFMQFLLFIPFHIFNILWVLGIIASTTVRHVSVDLAADSVKIRSRWLWVRRERILPFNAIAEVKYGTSSVYLTLRENNQIVEICRQCGMVALCQCGWKMDRIISHLDIVFQIIIKERFNLNSKIENIEVKTNKFYKVTDRAVTGELTSDEMFISFDNELTSETIRELTSMSYQNKKVILKDRKCRMIIYRKQNPI